MILRRVLLLAAVVAAAVPCFCQARPAAFQPGPRFEVFAGYSKLRGDFGTDARASGWNGGVTLRLNRFVGFDGKLFGAYAKADVAGQNTNMHGLLIGPRLSLPVSRVTVSALGGLGLARWQRAGVLDFTHVNPPGHPISIAKWFGGSLDVRLTQRISLRPLEVDYVKTTFMSGQNGLFSSGVVYRLTR